MDRGRERDASRRRQQRPHLRPDRPSAGRAHAKRRRSTRPLAGSCELRPPLEQRGRLTPRRGPFASSDRARRPGVRTYTRSDQAQGAQTRARRRTSTVTAASRCTLERGGRCVSRPACRVEPSAAGRASRALRPRGRRPASPSWPASRHGKVATPSEPREQRTHPRRACFGRSRGPQPRRTCSADPRAAARSRWRDTAKSGQLQDPRRHTKSRRPRDVPARPDRHTNRRQPLDATTLVFPPSELTRTLDSRIRGSH